MTIPNVPSGEVADMETRTPEKIFSLSMFSSSDHVLQHAILILSTITSHQEIIYTHVPPTWAGPILDRLDREFEGRFRKNYNPVTSIIWIRAMPTRVHDCHQPWVVSQKFEWTVSGLITAAEFHFLNVFVGTTINFVGGPYSGAIKEPDLLIQPDNQHLPSVIIESGWSESVPRLRDDMNLWLVGGGGKVRAAIILSWQRLSNTNQVRGNLELYTLDRNGMPQHNTDLAIFPSPTPAVAAAQQLILTRREVFGDHVPPGRNPTDQLPFSINILRGEARDALQLMGLIPA